MHTYKAHRQLIPPPAFLLWGDLRSEASVTLKMLTAKLTKQRRLGISLFHHYHQKSFGTVLKAEATCRRHIPGSVSVLEAC